MARKRKEVVSTEASPTFHQPFAALAGLKASLPEAPVTEPVPSAAQPSGAEAAADDAAPARAVIRRSKKGRGGREVTELSHLALPPETLAAWAKTLRTQLGCGGAVEGEVLVLHGDQRERVEAWLKARGVRKITRG